MQQPTLFDEEFNLQASSAPPEQRRKRRTSVRVKRAKNETLNVFRSFLVECKQTLERGLRINVKKLQNQFHVGHFPKSYLPVAELNKMKAAEIDLEYTKGVLSKIQEYNKTSNRKIEPNYVRPHYERAAQYKTIDELNKQAAVRAIDEAITSLQTLRSKLYNIINS